MLQQAIHIYTESTPNPHSMKFVFNFELLPDGLSFDYTQPSDGLTKEKNSPLAVALFGFDFVKRVFITSNFITLTKSENTLWEDELFGIKQYLKKYFEEKKPVFSIPQEAMSDSSRNDRPFFQRLRPRSPGSRCKAVRPRDPAASRGLR